MFLLLKVIKNNFQYNSLPYDFTALTSNSSLIKVEDNLKLSIVSIILLLLFFFIYYFIYLYIYNFFFIIIISVLAPSRLKAVLECFKIRHYFGDRLSSTKNPVEYFDS